MAAKIFSVGTQLQPTSRSISSLGGSAMMKYGANMDIGSKVALSAALGGTAEALGGGKFANGAITGAFVGLFNHARHQKQNQNKSNFPSSNELETELAESFQHRVVENIENMTLRGAPENWAIQIADEILSTNIEASNAGYGGEPIKVLIGIYNGLVEDVTSNNLNPIFDPKFFSPADYTHVPFLPTALNPGYNNPIVMQGPNGTTIGFVVQYRYLDAN